MPISGGRRVSAAATGENAACLLSERKSRRMTEPQLSLPLQSPPATHAPDWLRDRLLGLENKQSLDPALRSLEALLGKVLVAPSVLSTLRGEQIGHAIHPLLTDVPIGAFLSATVLDLTASPRLRPAATVLVATGLVAVLPTALTGLAEWFVS